MSKLLALSALVATAASAMTQTSPSAHDVSTRLHAARLREVLDLDVTGAVAEYQAIANDRTSRERWLAVTRLAELQRAGLPVTQPAPIAEAPPAIRDALAALTPIPWAELLQQAAAPLAPTEPPTTSPPLAMHPATLEAQRWLRSKSGPSFSDRQRQRAATTRNRADAARNDTARIDRINATDIVRRELEGKLEEANGRRDLFFRNWRPPTSNDEPQVVVARVRANLEAWLKEPNQSPGQLEVLGRLRDEIESRAAIDPRAALRLVERLPIYAERLLAEPSK